MSQKCPQDSTADVASECAHYYSEPFGADKSGGAVEALDAEVAMARAAHVWRSRSVRSSGDPRCPDTGLLIM